MPSSHKRNVFFSGIAMLTASASAFLLTPYVIEQIGTTRYGIWAVCTTIFGFSGLIDVGIRPSLTQRLTRAVFRKNQNYVNAVFSAGHALTSRISLVVVCITSCVVVLVHASDISPDLKWETITAALAFGALAAVKFLLFPYNAIIQAFRRFDIDAKLELAELLLVSLLTFSAITVSPNLGTLAIASTFPALVMLAARPRIASRLAPAISKYPPRHSVKRLLLRTGALRVASGISNQISRQIDSITILIICGAPAIAGYAVASSLSLRFMGIAQTFAPTIFGHASSAFAERDNDQIESLLIHSTKYTLLAITPIALISIIYSDSFFTLWLANTDLAETSTPIAVYRLLATSTLVVLATVPTTQVLQATENLSILAKLTIAEAVTNLSFSVFLGFNYGPIGVASATLIAALIIHLPGRITAATSICATRIPRFLTLTSLRPMLCVAAFLPAISLVRSNISPNSWSLLILSGLVSLVVWTLIAALIGLTAEERNGLRLQMTLRLSR